MEKPDWLDVNLVRFWLQSLSQFVRVPLASESPLAISKLVFISEPEEFPSFELENNGNEQRKKN